MQVEKIQFFEKADQSKHRDFIDAHYHCVLCKTPLSITYSVDLNSLLVKEEASCPKCSVKARCKNYQIH